MQCHICEFLVPDHDLNDNCYNLSDESVKYDTRNISHKEYNSRIEGFNVFSNYSSGDSGGSRFNNVIKYNSEAYCAIVLEAYENGIINSGEFSKFTDLKKKFIPDLQKRLYGVE